MTSTISWYAVRVAPKAEFRVQGAISRLERPAIMPYGERSVARENRPSLRRWRKYPIIPGYVFAGFFDMTDFAGVRMTINAPLEHRGQPKDVLGLVGFGNKPATLSASDVEMLTTLTDAPPVEEVPFIKGQNVTVYGQRTRVHSVNMSKRELKAFVSLLGGMRLVNVGFDTVQAA